MLNKFNQVEIKAPSTARLFSCHDTRSFAKSLKLSLLAFDPENQLKMLLGN